MQNSVLTADLPSNGKKGCNPVHDGQMEYVGRDLLILGNQMGGYILELTLGVVFK